MNINNYLQVNKLLQRTFILYLLFAACLTNQNAYADCVYQSPAAEAYGPIVKSFKVMSVNVFGQHGVKTDGACQDRLREIGRHIRDASEPYDIVGLQEWHTDTAATCNGVVLKNRIDDIYPVSGVNQGEHTMDHYQWAHPKAYDQNDGGLGIISKTRFLWDPYTENDFGSLFSETHTETENVHQFTPRFNNTGPLAGVARTAHGFLFARIFLNRNPDIAVDTYVVHLTSTSGFPNPTCNLKCKRGMLEQLREGIHQRSANSGFPVLVMGDFNIGGPLDNINSPEPCAGADGYKDIMENLGNPKDLWLDGNLSLSSEEGATYNSGNASKRKRIDYIFVPNDPFLVNSPYVITHKSPRTIDHVQLSNSDHRAVIATLDIHKKLNTELHDGLVTIQQKSTMRYLDAHESSNNDFRLVTRPKQQNKSQTWQLKSLGDDLFTIKQQSSARFVDAHEYQAKDFSVVSRPPQNNETQRWLIKSLGNNLFTVRQQSSGRYLDAHVIANDDFSVVTRTSQNNDTQRWIIKPLVLKNKLPELVKTKCNAGADIICRRNGASCEVLVSNAGDRKNLCRWENVKNNATCSKTPGIWTLVRSKYAKNHQGAIRVGELGACISESKNIGK